MLQNHVRLPFSFTLTRSCNQVFKYAAKKEHFILKTTDCDSDPSGVNRVKRTEATESSGSIIASRPLTLNLSCRVSPGQDERLHRLRALDSPAFLSSAALSGR